MDEATLKAFEAIRGELNTLAAQLHLHSAQIRATNIYAIAKIADLRREDRNTAFAKVQEMTRQIYDDWLLKMEKINPAYAAQIDIRNSLSPEDQEIWYLSSLPKEDEQPPNTGQA